VTALAVTVRTQALLRSSRRAGGAAVDAVPQGYAIPLDALVVRPRAYAETVRGAGQGILRLRGGTALLSRTSARLRGLEAGGRLTLAGGRELRIGAIVADELIGFAELVLTRRDAADVNAATRQLLIATTRPERVLRRLAGNDAVRARTLSPTLRTAPRLVARPLETKAKFGEFAVGLPYGSDWVRIEPRWLKRNIVTRSIPILAPSTATGG
jgi:hypothetical protein